MKGKTYGTYRGCEICRDCRGWYFTAPVRSERFGEPVALKRRRVYVEDPIAALDAVVAAIDEHLGVHA